MLSIASWRTVSIFVTSTFRDMHGERDHLRGVVFPELAERLRQRLHHLEVVDLRWGVETASLKDEAAKDEEVLRVCLDEIERCRPFQIALIGERYGHVLPASSLTHVADRLGCAPDALAETSITATEIEFGILAPWVKDLCAYVYCRKPLDLRQLPSDALANYTDRRAGQEKAHGRLEVLKGRIAQAIPERCRSYAAAWDEEKQCIEPDEAFESQVLDDLWSELDGHTAAFVQQSPRNVTEQQKL